MSACKEPQMRADAMKEQDLLDLECLILALDDLPMDCNGITDLFSHILERYGTEHLRMSGMAINEATRERVFPHCWIELPSGTVMDIRLRKWLGDDDEIPHGIVPKGGAITYRGAVDPRPRLSIKQLEIMGDFDVKSFVP